jgi:hypothetical protein
MTAPTSRSVAYEDCAIGKMMKRRDGRWTVAVVSFGGQGKTGQCHQLQAGPYLMAEVRTVRQVAEALATGGYTLADLEEAADESPPGCSAEPGLCSLSCVD